MKASRLIGICILAGFAQFARAEDPPPSAPAKPQARGGEQASARQAPPAARTTIPPRGYGNPGMMANPAFRRDGTYPERSYRLSPSRYGQYDPRRYSSTAEQPDGLSVRRTAPGVVLPNDEAQRARVIPSGRPNDTATTADRRNRLDRYRAWNPAGTAFGVRDGQRYPSGASGNGRVQGNYSRNGDAVGGTNRDANGRGRSYSEVWRNYHHDHHDRNWWHNHHERILLISGGYYYWDAGYWFPAWGYDASYSNYAFDGPIYSGDDGLPPDEVISSVQNALQEEGYYRGVVDGELGSMTRAALAAWQRDHGLAITTVIDEPTMQSLGL